MKKKMEKHSVVNQSMIILEKIYNGEPLKRGYFNSEREINLILNYLKEKGFIDFVWHISPNEFGLNILSEKITPKGIEFIESSAKIAKDIINSPCEHYAVMGTDKEAKFYEVFYKGKRLNDCRGIIRISAGRSKLR